MPPTASEILNSAWMRRTQTADSGLEARLGARIGGAMWNLVIAVSHPPALRRIAVDAPGMVRSDYCALIYR
jgi:hypothetical protein